MLCVVDVYLTRRKLYMVGIHPTEEKQAKRTPDTTVETTHHPKLKPFLTSNCYKTGSKITNLKTVAIRTLVCYFIWVTFQRKTMLEEKTGIVGLGEFHARNSRTFFNV